MTAVTELDLPAIDLDSDELAGDRYHRRLAEAARARAGWPARRWPSWCSTARRASSSSARGETAFPGREIADLFGVTSGPLREQIDANILNQQGDRHRRLRALVGPAFTPRAADRWRPVMRGFLGRALGPASAPATGCDFVAALAKPYPSLTIAAVLGAPDRDAAAAARVVEPGAAAVRHQGAGHPGAARSSGRSWSSQEYVEALLQQRRAEPGDDLITALLAAEDQGDRLSHAECVNLVLNVIAGRDRHHPGPAVARDAAVRRAPGPVAAAARGPGPDRAGGGRGAPGRADHPVHRPDLHRRPGAPRRAVPGRHDRGDLRRAGQPGAGRRRGLRHHRGARRAGC